MEKKTLKQIISEIDFKNVDLVGYPEWGDIASHFNIYDYIEGNDRLKCYYIRVWLCTDTWVGTQAYFLDDEFVFLLNKEARKSSSDLAFFSLESAEKVHKYIRSFVEDTNIRLTLINDFDNEMDPFYTIQYSSQILHKKAYYHLSFDDMDEWIEVDIIETYDDYMNFHDVKIKLPSNDILVVDCRDLRFKYNNLK